MFQNKKIIILLISIISVIAIATATTLVMNKIDDSKKPVEESKEALSAEELENKFKNAFNNIEYSQNEEEAVARAYDLKKEQENKYSVNVNLPKINKDTEIARNNKQRNNQHIWHKTNRYCIQLERIYTI